MEFKCGDAPSQGAWKNLQIVQVEDADTLWVRECSSVHITKNLSEFQKMEAQMNEKFGKIFFQQPVKTFPVKIGERVLAYYKNHWYRAHVMDISDTCKAEVFLLDYGISIKVEATAVIAIKDTEWASVSYQAKKVCLFALTPLSLGYALTATGFSVIPRESMVWDPAATSFVKRLAELKPRTEFLPLQAGKDGCIQGLVTLYFGTEACEAIPELIEMKWPKNQDSEIVVDLAKLLVACEFAKFATEVLIDRMRFNCNEGQDPDPFQRETLLMDAWQEKVTTDSESELGEECVEKELIELMLRKRKYSLPRSRGLMKMVEHGIGDSETTSNIGSSTASLNPSSRSSSRGRGLLNLLEVKHGTSSPLSRGNSSNALSSVDGLSNIDVEDELCKRPATSSINLTNYELKPHEFTNYCLEEIPAPSSSSQKNILGGMTVDNELDSNGCTLSSKTKSEKLCSILGVNSTDTSVAKIKEGKSTYQNCETDDGSAYCMKLDTSNESGIQIKELKIPGSGSVKNKAATSKSEDAICIQTLNISKKTKPGCKACFKSDSRDVWDREDMGCVEQEFHVSLKNRNTYEGPCIAKLYRIFVAGEIPIALEDVIVDECMLDAILNSHIVKVLNDLQMKATRLQSFAWPVIARGTSAVIIDGKKSGKTLGYIVPIMSTLLDTWQHVSQRLVKGIGAIVIIICNDWRTAKYAGDSLVRFLPPQIVLKVIATWGGCGFEGELNASLQLLGGCDILVTTAPCLVRLLLGEMIDPTYTKEKTDTKAFTSLARCCYLVFDDIDLILEIFANEVKQILKWWGEARNKNQRRDFDQQLLLVASSWTKLLNSLIQTLSPLLDPTIIIAEPWEAAIATKACTFVHPVEEGASEHDEIVKLLQENRHGRILVFVQDDEWARKLKILLDAVTLYSLVVLGSTTMWVMQSVVHEWHLLSNIILIVCQEATPLLLMHDLSNAELIFHTDSLSSMSAFKMRYAFMVNNFSTDLSKDTLNCESHVMLSKRSVNLFPSLVLELSRSCNIPEDIKMYASHVLNGCNKYNALCYYLKAYGRCSIGYNCVFRHRIQHTDLESIIPRKGEVTFSVVKVMNASRYLIRLLSFKDKAGDSGFLFQDHFLTLFMAIQQHYADPENCEQLINADTGMQCAVKCKENWARGHIIDVDYGKHKPFTVFLMDEGNEVSLGMESIFSLSKQFTFMPPLIVEAYLCRVQPIDFDKEWTFHASKYIDDVFNSTNSKSTFIGKIALSLGTTMWLSPVIELVQTGKNLVKMESLRSRLISNGFGIDNPNHIDILKKMCREAGISLSAEEFSCEMFKITMEKALKCLKDAKHNSFSAKQRENFIREEISHNRDFQQEVRVVDNVEDISGSEPTDTSAEDGEVEGIVTCEQVTNLLLQETLLQDADVKVAIAEIESPEWFFVQRNDKYEKLVGLELEVDEVTKHWVKEDHEILNKRSLSWEENPCITSSSYCLAKFSDGNYYRGWVDKVMKDGMAKVFFVDHGETVNIPVTQVQPCPAYLLKALPAQAIPCCLADFSFPSANEKEVKKMMEQVADSVETWTARVLEVVESDDGKMYRVELTDTSMKPPRCMSKELAQSLLLLEEEQTSQSACNKNFQSEKIIDVSCLGEEEALTFLQNFPNFKELSNSVTSKNVEKRDQDSSVKVEKPSKTKSSELHNEENKAISELEHQEKAQNDTTNTVDYNISSQIQQEHSRNMGNAKQLKNDSDMFNQMCVRVPPLQAVKGVTRRLYPETLWNQTENMVVVCIQLPGVQHYKCRFASNHLTFMTILREKFYMIEEKLADEIDTDSSSLKLRGMSVLIYLAKKSNTMWPTLFAEKGKRAWLRFGYQDSRLDDKKSLLSDDTNEWNDIEPWTDMQIEEEMNQRGGFPAGISDSSSESHSDEDVDELIT